MAKSNLTENNPYDFQASMGLFDCFQRRFKTKRVSLHGGDKEATVKYLETFKQIIEDKIYKPEHVFNVDKRLISSVSTKSEPQI